MHPLRKLGALLVEGKPYNTGFGTFLGPFNASGFYVNDARGTTVAECPNQQIAKELTKILNEKFPRKDK